MKNQIIQGDCLEVMQDVTDGSVDMILCDLPYGTTQNKWDSIIPLEPLWSHYKRILKSNGVVVLTAQTPFDKVLGASNVSWLKYEFIWVKNCATGHMNANRAPMKKHENVLVFYKEQPVYNPQMTPGKPYKQKRSGKDDNGSNYGRVAKRTDTLNEGWRYPVSVVEFSRETGLHPTQKPVALFEFLVRTYTNPGDLVLDNCIGSGTTAIACINSDRHYLGVERDPHYHQIASKRVQEHLTLKEVPGLATDTL